MLIKLHCQHRDEGGGRCNVCAATVQNGVVTIPLWHGRQRHDLVITLADLERLVRQDRERRDPALLDMRARKEA